MSGPVLYSANPWFAFDVGCRLRNNMHHVWCSEAFDPKLAVGTHVGMVAPTSSPLAIACQLRDHVKHEEKHSPLLKRYKRTFRLLAATWRKDGSITEDQAEEMLGLVNATSWQMWRPLVYIVPRDPIEKAGRLHLVPVKERAGHGPEYRIYDLKTREFDVWEWGNA